MKHIIIVVLLFSYFPLGCYCYKRLFGSIDDLPKFGTIGWMTGKIIISGGLYIFKTENIGLIAIYGVFVMGLYISCVAAYVIFWPIILPIDKLLTYICFRLGFIPDSKTQAKNDDTLKYLGEE